MQWVPLCDLPYKYSYINCMHLKEDFYETRNDSLKDITWTVKNRTDTIIFLSSEISKYSYLKFPTQNIYKMLILCS